jgi:hypothetical protein
MRGKEGEGGGGGGGEEKGGKKKKGREGERGGKRRKKEERGDEGADRKGSEGGKGRERKGKCGEKGGGQNDEKFGCSGGHSLGLSQVRRERKSRRTHGTAGVGGLRNKAQTAMDMNIPVSNETLTDKSINQSLRNQYGDFVETIGTKTGNATNGTERCWEKVTSNTSDSDGVIDSATDWGSDVIEGDVSWSDVTDDAGNIEWDEVPEETENRVKDCIESETEDD